MHTCHQLPQKGLYAVAGCLPIGENRAPATPRVRSTSFREPWVSPPFMDHRQHCNLTPLTQLYGIPKPQPPRLTGGVGRDHPTLPCTQTHCWGTKRKGENHNKKMRIKGLPAQITARKNAPLFLRVGLFFLPLFGLAYSCLQLPLLVA